MGVPPRTFQREILPLFLSNSKRPDPKMNNRPILSVPGNGKGFHEQVLDAPALRFVEQAGFGSHLVRQPQCWRNWDPIGTYRWQPSLSLGTPKSTLVVVWTAQNNPSQVFRFWMGLPLNSKNRTGCPAHKNLTGDYQRGGEAARSREKAHWRYIVN